MIRQIFISFFLCPSVLLSLSLSALLCIHILKNMIFDLDVNMVALAATGGFTCAKTLIFDLDVNMIALAAAG